MRATVMHAAGDVRIENVPDARPVTAARATPKASRAALVDGRKSDRGRGEHRMAGAGELFERSLFFEPCQLRRLASTQAELGILAHDAFVLGAGRFVSQHGALDGVVACEVRTLVERHFHGACAVRLASAPMLLAGLTRPCARW